MSRPTLDIGNSGLLSCKKPKKGWVTLDVIRRIVASAPACAKLMWRWLTNKGRRANSSAALESMTR
jgi:hypothetical protein